jgi:hypothetical protein
VKEARVDILSAEILKTADAICFTSNGVVKPNGELVMGAGVAKAFADKWPPLAIRAGHCVKMGGNRVHWLRDIFTYRLDDGCHKYVSVVSFPTKNNWKNPSSLPLIIESAKQLSDLTNIYKWKSVYLPRPGVGLGGLDWSVVKAAIEPLLDDRFTVVYK